MGVIYSKLVEWSRRKLLGKKTPQPHPIWTNPDILPKIFEMVDPKDLPGLRLVNRTWNEQATLQIKQVPHLYPIEILDETLLANLRKLVQNSKDFPFTCLTFALLPHDAFLDCLFLRRFFFSCQKISWTMKIESAWHLLWRFFGGHVRLWNEFMTFGSSWISEIHAQQIPHQIPTNVTFSKLRTLNLTKSTISSWVVRVIKNCPVLSEIRLSNVETVILRRLARIKNLKLTSIRLDFDEDVEVDADLCDAVCSFLQSQGKNLTDLVMATVNLEIDLLETSVKKLHLLNLTTLNFKWTDNVHAIHERHIRYSELEKMRMVIQEAEFNAQFNRSHGDEYDLNVDLISFPSRKVFLEEAPKIFPNLKILKLLFPDDGTLGNDQLWKFVRQLEHLEELQLWMFAGSIEEKLDVKTILGSKSRAEIREEEWAVLKCEYRNKLAYSALSRLKVLRLHYLLPMLYITDVTCQLVFLQLPKLELLHFLNHTNIEEISEPVMNKMKAKFEVLTDDKR